MFPTEVARAFGLTSAIFVLFQHERNMDYVGEIPDVSYYGADAMSAKERAEFLA